MWSAGAKRLCGAVFGTRLLMLVACAGVVNAAEQGGKAESEGEREAVVRTEEVVVSATKTPVPVSHLTSAVEVFTEQDLQRQRFKTVADALRYAQGLAVFSRGGPGTDTSVRIRGGNPDQTLVLIDGAIANSGTLGQYNFANLTTDNIERLEILRGPQSMLWGSDAMGGVINIRTKRGQGAPTASAFFEYGSFQSIREGGQASGQKGPLDFSVSLSRWDFTGFSAVNYRRGAAERDAFRNWQGSSRVGLTLPRDGRLEFNFRWLNGDINLDNSFGPSDVFQSKSTSRQFVYSGVYEQPIIRWWSQVLTVARQQETLVTQAGTNQRNVVTGVESTPSAFNNSNIRTLSNRVEWQHNYQVSDPLLISLGYQYRDQQGENDSLSAIPNKSLASHAGFAQGQLNLWERVFATAGFRQDSYNVFGDATTYRVTGGYLHKETDTKVRASYGSGFRAPTINQLFFPNFGNPNLQPEKSQGMDVGLDQTLFSRRLKVSVGYFWNRFRNLILSVQDATVCGVGPFGANFCAVNVGSARTEGWEAGLDVTLLEDRPWARSLTLRAQYTNTHTRDLGTNNRLPQWPIDQWGGVLSYRPMDPLQMNLAVRYVGSRFNDQQNLQSMKAFDVWTLSATYDMNKWMQVYTRVDNLFDEKYEEIRFFGTAPRSIYVGVTMNLSGGRS